MATLLKLHDGAKKDIDALIGTGKDLRAKAETAESTGVYKDWLCIFDKWREETVAKLTALYEERDMLQEFRRC